MATLAEVIKERREAFKEINKSLRSVDSQIEKTQRLIKRLLARKNKVPESTDLSDISSEVRTIDIALDSTVGIIESAGNVFGI